MENDQELKRQRNYANRRALMDFGMGIIYAAMGVFVIVMRQKQAELEFLPGPFAWIFAGICLLYGGFRIYRGYKKNYFRE